MNIVISTTFTAEIQRNKNSIFGKIGEFMVIFLFLLLLD